MRQKEDYGLWNSLKQELNQKNRKKNIQVGEVRRYYCGVNIGNEIGKGAKGNFRRVCLVLNTNMGNGLLLIAPMTTKNKKLSIPNSIKMKSYDVDARLLLDQICLVDAKRFIYRRPFTYSKKFVKSVIYYFQKLIRLKK